MNDNEWRNMNEYTNIGYNTPSLWIRRILYGFPIDHINPGYPLIGTISTEPLTTSTPFFHWLEDNHLDDSDWRNLDR